MTDVVPKPVPRGVRLCNPGNIRHSADHWAGLSQTQPDMDFCQFVAAEWGIRALLIVLCTYQARYHLYTTAGIIGRWAPPVENATGAYTGYVAGCLCVDPHATINLHDPATARTMATAIIAMECAHWLYSDDVLSSALRLAGIVPAAPAGAAA